MIKNIVFDLGKVLIDFSPLQYLERFKFEQDVKLELLKIIFESKDWNEYDRGVYENIAELAQKLSEQYPRYEKEIKLVMSNDWVKILKVKQDTLEYLKELKIKNFKIYILSNIPEDAYNFISQYDFFQYVNGGVYSYELKICKPDEQIYKILLKKYNLVPEETVFIDDRLENVQSANRLGIHGIQFITLSEAKQKIELLIK